MMKEDLVQSFLKNNELTLVGTFCRHQMVKPWFDALEKMELPRDKIHLLIYNNSNSVAVHKSLQEQLKLLEKKYHSITYYQSNRKVAGVLIGDPVDDFETNKLNPIWGMWNDLNKMIKTDVFMLIEDDTIAPPHAFYTLLNDLISIKKAGFVIAVETGRTLFSWCKVRVGVHRVVVENGKLLRRVSLPPDSEGVQEINSSGVYCFVAYKKAWLSGFEGYDPKILKVPLFAMDNVMTYNMTTHGYKLYADFNVWCDHLQLSAGELVAFNKKQAVQMADIWMPEFDNYAQSIEIKKNIIN